MSPGAGRDGIWCPRLEDLLSLVNFIWTLDCALDGDCAFFSGGTASVAKVPVEAVARWLLARKEGTE